MSKDSPSSSIYFQAYPKDPLLVLHFFTTYKRSIKHLAAELFADDNTLYISENNKTKWGINYNLILSK